MITRSRSQGQTKAKLQLTKDQATPMEQIKAITYISGCIAYVIGSVFYLPILEDNVNIGAILFIIGSMMFSIVSFHDLIECFRKYNSDHDSSSECDKDGFKHMNAIELLVTICNLCGSLLYTVGSILFLPSIYLSKAGAWNFIIGSSLFLLGAFTSPQQNTPSMLVLFYSNINSTSFVIGSLLFLVASIPYLWDLDYTDDTRTLYTFVANEFIIGSIFFLLGGVVDWKRMCYMNTYYHDGLQKN